MSILIKGMKMPENCFHCQMGYRYGDVDNAKLMCTITAKVIPLGKSLEIMKNCPLVEIPPHGRVIDADKVMARVRGAIIANFSVRERNDAVTQEELVLNWIKDQIDFAPTVIESEEKNNEDRDR